ncbi:MAG: winged helix DNA-binding protein [archaeon]|jgi:DNA-binding MarR family transcriptional regulator|nr:hypothetical protein [Euryarchaeota archaeon]MDP6704402.1 winged helix DNA-binding protein [archaeon]MDP7260847.1 winged helix DNA-binding protein [archaeon]HIK01360.1 winged helix DNA-binding protein [Candidatus Undinarchaeales archaeon ERR594346 U_76725]|tara:strand:- start:5345 stop:5698 length:354 start_codon:yes stop_codon:yes gene_type:complete
MGTETLEENQHQATLENLFLRPKPARLLVSIGSGEKPYALALAKEIDCTYAHTVKLLMKMEELGLVTFNKEGRTKFVELTDHGKDLADEFEILLTRRIPKRMLPVESVVEGSEGEAE